MGSPRGDSARTRKAILAAARELFAAHGVDGVSVRRIAAAAGVNHALVHRYFGSKSDIVGAILVAEVTAIASVARPSADMGESLAALRQTLRYALTPGRTSLLLMLRAEMDGLAPEHLLGAAPLRPVGQLARWLEGEGAAGDAAAVAMVVGAALMGLAAAQPMLADGAGLGAEGRDAVTERCLDVLVGLVAAALGGGAGPRPAGS